MKITMTGARGSGKTEALIVAAKTAINQPGTKVLIVTPGIFQSRLLYKRLRDKAKVTVSTYSTIDYMNGSSAYFYWGAGYVKGKKVDVVLIDNADYVSQDVLDTVPTLGAAKVIETRTEKTNEGHGVLG